MNIAVLVTCYNRAPTTIKNIGVLIAALEGVSGVQHTIYLVDDCSPDGTGKLVANEYPSVKIAMGTGQLYWSGGMRLAHSLAKDSGEYDAYLLFNDDVEVLPLHVQRFFDDWYSLNVNKSPLLVAATMNPSRTAITYSGFNSVSNWRPRATTRVEPNSDVLVPVDMPNGNFLLVEAEFFDSIGGIDENYRHGHGDIDLGMVAKRLGKRVLMARHPVGICNTNAPLRDQLAAVDLNGRWRILSSDKHSSHDYLTFCRKHYPTYLMPLYGVVFLLRKLRMLVQI